MTDLDRALLRKLAEWRPEGVPVTSLSLNVDGSRYRRRSEYEVRLDELLRRAKAQATEMSDEAGRSVDGDLAAMSAFVRQGSDRGDTRGIALFSASGAGLWEDVRVSRPLRDRAVVAPRAEVRMLEVLLETYGATCATLTDYEKARIFLLHLGRVEEVHDLLDEVPGRHDQGGRAQMRRQRHVDDHRRQHLKHVAELLFRVWKSRGFEHLVLAGPGDAHLELEAELHEYLRRRVRARPTLAMTASTADVRTLTLRIEEELEREAERAVVERLVGATAAAGGGVVGLEDTLSALADGRVGTLVVRVDLEHRGAVCDACGRLSTTSGPCPACGRSTRELADVVEVAVATAYGQGCRVETVTQEESLVDPGGIGALLRF